MEWLANRKHSNDQQCTTASEDLRSLNCKHCTLPARHRVKSCQIVDASGALNEAGNELSDSANELAFRRKARNDDRKVVNGRIRSVPPPARLRNVLQFGDSESERVALFQATKCLPPDALDGGAQTSVSLDEERPVVGHLRGKSFKFAEQPTTKVLELEHVLICQSFKQMVYFDGNLDLRIDVPPSSESESGPTTVGEEIDCAGVDDLEEDQETDKDTVASEASRECFSDGETSEGFADSEQFGG
eukprot:Selendium_serpulae@DN5382_c0_g1_i1.p1